MGKVRIGMGKSSHWYQAKGEQVEVLKLQVGYQLRGDKILAGEDVESWGKQMGKAGN